MAKRKEARAKLREYFIANVGKVLNSNDLRAVAGEPHPYDLNRSTRLHIGHIIDKSQGGTDDIGNLRAICSVCNEGASNLTLPRPSDLKLLAQVRRATGKSQLAVLKWLIRKFPTQAKAMLDQTINE